MIFRWGSLGIGILIVIFLGLQAGSWLKLIIEFIINRYIQQKKKLGKSPSLPLDIIYVILFWCVVNSTISFLNINDLSESVQVWGVEDICDDIEDDDDDLVLSKEGFVSSRVNVVRPTTAMAVNIAHSQGNSLSQKVLFSNSSFLSYR